MSTYLFKNHPFNTDLPDFQLVLKDAYIEKLKPLCACNRRTPPMYIAHVGQQYIIKRMPGTGGDHDPDCQHFEFSDELTGKGEVFGKAIQEDQESGITKLKFDFSLSKGASRSVPTPSGIDHGAVGTDGKKLTLRGLLHYLWEEAGLNRWSPKMNNKRNWFVVRKYIQEKLIAMSAKNLPLAESLFLPEFYRMEDEADIELRRKKALKPLYEHKDGKQNLMIVVGEIKSIKPATYDYVMVLKHLPRMPIYLHTDLFTRMNKKFANEIALSTVNEDCHLMVIGTFGMSKTGVATFNELSLMIVDKHWLPFENTFEFDLLQKLISDDKRFVKALRYNLGTDKPIASALMPGANENIALYVIPMGSEQQFRTKVDQIVEESKTATWVWDTEQEMPVLPI